MGGDSSEDVRRSGSEERWLLQSMFPVRNSYGFESCKLSKESIDAFSN
jgi:hypothetical protein